MNLEPSYSPSSALIALVSLCLVSTTVASSLDWSRLPPLPNKLGVAGAFAGGSGGALLVAGGANFPEGFPWQNGKKVWHDPVYALSEPNAQWRLVGKLPRPLAYGVSLTTRRGILCVGGSGATRHYADTFLLKWSRGRLTTSPLPGLPLPLANAAGALVGSTVYIACGSEQPGEISALNRCFTMDLKATPLKWEEIDPCPGKPRILPVAATLAGGFYLAGGAAIEPLNGRPARIYLRDSWRYRPGQGWHRLAGLPKPSVAAPSPAPVDGSAFFIVGGDDGSLAGFQPVEKHPGFPKAILGYDAAMNIWSTNGEVPAPRATTPTVFWRGRYIIPSGEVRPGVRSPEIWGLNFGGNR
ncbi:MAG TPA: galactose oxidase [Verrucomicrobiae bacterium]